MYELIIGTKFGSLFFSLFIIINAATADIHSLEK